MNLKGYKLLTRGNTQKICLRCHNIIDAYDECDCGFKHWRAWVDRYEPRYCPEQRRIKN